MDPFADGDYKAGRIAQEAGNLRVARAHYELAAKRDNPVAVLELAEVCFGLGDLEAVRSHAARLEQLAHSSAEAAYVASKAFEIGACVNVVDPEHSKAKRKAYLLKAAELGNPGAQIELAANFAYGTNGFPEDLNEFQRWIELAAKIRRREAANCYVEVASAKHLPMPSWVSKA